MYFRLIYLLIIPVVLYFYHKKKNLFKSVLLFIILLIFSMVILKEKLNFEFQVKKDIPVILMIDASRSFNKNIEIAKNFLKYFDDFYYFSDVLSKKTNFLNYEFSYIYKNISTLKEKLKKNVKIVVFSDLQDNSNEKNFDPYNVYFLYKENTNYNNLSIYEIKIDENIFSGEPFEVELQVYSQNETNILFYLKEKEILYKEVIKLSKGLNTIKKVLKFDFTGFKNLSFGVGTKEIERLINFSKETYRIFLATSYPDEEYVFLKRFLHEFKWITIDSKVLLHKNDKINITKKYNGHIFINFTPEHSIDLKKLSNSIFVFTESKKNTLITPLTNKGIKEKITNEYGKIYILSNNIRITEGINSWKIKLKQAILNPSENFYSKYWFENLKDFLTERKNFFEKYNYILNENAPFDTSKIGIFEKDKIKYKVNYNEKEDFYPIFTLDTNNLKIFNVDKINLKEFIKNLKSESKIIEKIQIKIDFSSNIFVLIILLILLFIFWFYNKF